MAMIRGYSAATPTSFTQSYDDFGDAVAGAGTLDGSGHADGAIEQIGDRDWIAITVEAGQSYVVQARGWALRDGTLSNPALRIVDAAGNPVSDAAGVVADDDSGVGQNAEVTFKPLASGTYYIEVTASGNSQTGSYEVQVLHTDDTTFVNSIAPIVNVASGSSVDAPSIIQLTEGPYAGGFVVAWGSRIDGQHAAPHEQNSHLQVQIIDANGNIVDLDVRPDLTTYSPDKVGTNNQSGAGNASIVLHADGSFTVVYTDTSWDSVSFPKDRVTFLTFAADGTPTTTPDAMTPSATGGFDAYGSVGSDAVRLADGTWLTSMSRYGIDGPIGTPGTAVQISVNGANPTADHVLDPATHFDGVTALATRLQTSISALGTGAVVVWTSHDADDGAGADNSDYSHQGIKGAILSASGAVLATFDANHETAFAQFISGNNQVVQLGDGRFVVAWTSSEAVPQGMGSAPTDVRLRIFEYDQNGSVAAVTAADIAVGGHLDGVTRGNPTLAALPSGGFVLVYEGPLGLLMQAFDRGGASIGAETVVASGFVGQPTVTVMADGRIAVAYVGDGNVQLQIMELNQSPTELDLDANAIDEGQGFGTVIGTLSTTDGNAQDSFTYELTDDAAGLFALDGTNLVWNQSAAPDFETRNSYSVTAKVTDSGGAVLTQTFTINVVDINEAPTGLAGYANPVQAYDSIAENSAEGTVIATFSALDVDAADQFTYELVDAVGMPFVIVGNQLLVDGPLDYELNGFGYDFKIRITDLGNQSVLADYSVDLINEDDVAPADISLSATTINEALPAGSVLGQLGATDSDTAADDLTFTLLDHTDLFEIATGQFGTPVVQTKVPLDHETLGSFDLQIRVSDAGGRSYDETFSITVADVNEAPTITTVGNSFTVAEGTSQVVNLDASDPDAGDTVFWTLGPTSTNFSDFFAFTIDSGTGQVAFVDPPGFGAPGDSDGNNSYTFKVSAYDNANLVATRDITVNVTANNSAPIITGGANASVSVNENTTVAAFISASDANNDPLTFALVGGPDLARFKLETVGGTARLSFVVAPNFEARGDVGGDNRYNVTVRVSDGHGGVADQAIAVNVVNVNEGPTAIGLSGTAVVENSATGTAIGTLSAVDPDVGDAATFSLLDNAGGRFAVSGNQLVVANGTLLDFEQGTSHAVTIRARDAGGFVIDRSVLISVANVNEAPTGIALSNASILENSSTGTIVGSLSASDPDAGSTASFTLLDSAGGRFALSGNQLVVADGVRLDFEQSNTHSVTVRATDAAGLSVERTIAISVGNIDPETAIGSAGPDILTGNTGNDTLNGGPGKDTLIGGGGNDLYIVDSSMDIVVEGSRGGTDTVRFTGNRGQTFSLPGNVENLELSGGAATNGRGNGLANAITGNKAANILDGGAGNDTLNGGLGNDTLLGGAGNDILIGGRGKDVMTGGGGRDRFVFDAAAETGKTAATRDIITDFTKGQDKIDLSTLDANATGAGNGRFVLVAEEGAAFTGTRGQLIFAHQDAPGGRNDKTIILADINGDRVVDFSIQLSGLKSLAAGDFVL